MLTGDVPILPWKHKKYTSGISLGNSSRLPFSNNEDCNKLRRVQIKYMFSVDGRNLKRILISEFVSGLSHFAGCPGVSALGHNISLFLQQPFSFILELRLPKLHSALWPAWWRFWVSADQCSLRICKILSACQLVCPFKPPFAYGTLLNKRGFSFCFTTYTGAWSFHESSCKLPPKIQGLKKIGFS